MFHMKEMGTLTHKILHPLRLFQTFC